MVYIEGRNRLSPKDKQGLSNKILHYLEPAKAYHIYTARLLIRCYLPQDVALLQAAIAENIAHLHPWMAWINREPLTKAGRSDQIARWRAQFFQGQDFTYGIFLPDGSRLIGSAGLHARVGPGAREIGYWIGKDFLGQGYATEAVRALLFTGFRIEGLQRIEIHCDESNLRSMAIPAKTGFTRQGYLSAGEDDARTVIWVLTKEAYAVVPYRYFPLKVFDARGNLLSGEAEIFRDSSR